jgi:hypothetical protein
MGAGALKGGGAAAAVSGIVGGLLALKMNTSIHSDSSYRYGSFTPSSDVINIGLLQNQHLAFLAAAVLFLAGVILIAAGFIVEAVSGSGYASGGARPATNAGQSEAHQLRARHRSEMTDEQRASAARTDRLILIIGSVVGLLALIAVLVFGVGAQRSDASADGVTMSNNAEALADAMERQADNMDAVADNIGALQ